MLFIAIIAPIHAQLGQGDILKLRPEAKTLLVSETPTGPAVEAHGIELHGITWAED